MNHFMHIAAMAELCRQAAQIGISLLFQSTLLIVLGLFAISLCRRVGAKHEAFVCKCVMAAVAATGLLTVVSAGYLKPIWTVSLPPAIRALADPHQEHTPIITTGPPAQPLTASTAREAQSESPDRLQDLQGQEVMVRMYPESVHPPLAERMPPHGWEIVHTDNQQPVGLSGWMYIGLTAIWLGVAALLLGWQTACHLSLRRLERTCTPITTGSVIELLSRLCRKLDLHQPRLMATPRLQSPFLTGIFRPVLFLPVGYETDFDPEALQAILTHELTHMQRHDCVWKLAVRIPAMMLWFQPLMWVLCRKWEQASEEICDHAAVDQNRSPLAYADCLLRLAERIQLSRSEWAAGHGVVAFRSSLAQRLQRITLASSQPLPSVSVGQRFALLVSALMGTALSLFLVSPTTASTDTPLAGDGRLDRKVAVTAEGIPVGDLLNLLAKKTGISMLADTYVADDKVIVFSPARPLRDTMDDIAALFNDTWLTRKEKDGQFSYSLIRDGKARANENELSRDTIKRMLVQLDKQVHALRETPEQLAKRAADDPIRVRLSKPDSRMATEFYSQLNADQRDAMFADNHLVVPFSALTPDQQQPLQQVFEEKRKRESDHLNSNTLTQEWLNNSGLAFGLDLTGGVLHAKMDFSYGHVELLEYGSVDFASVEDNAKLLPPHGNPYTGENVAKGAVLPIPASVTEATKAPSWIDQLQKLAVKSGSPVLADYYRCKPPEIKAQASGSAPPDSDSNATAAMDRFCKPEGYLWWSAQDKALLIRKQDWYTQRLYEAPDSWMIAEAEHLNKQKNIPSYEDVYRLTELTNAQIAGVNRLSNFSMRRDQKDIAGLSQLLAVFLATPNPMSGLIAPGLGVEQMALLTPDVLDRITLRFSSLTPQQRNLLPALLQAQPFPLAPNGADKFGARINCDADGTRPGQYGYSSVAVEITWFWGGTGSSWIVSLPATLPDDRRDRTKVQVVSP